MSVNRPLTVENQLLLHLPPADRDRISALSDCIELLSGTVLYKPGQIIEHAYFPLSAVICLMATLPDHHPLEMSLVGNEGMLGASLVLGVSTAPLQASVHSSGSCLHLSRVQLQAALIEIPELRDTLNHYLYLQVMQLAQSAACIHFHDIEQRLARWLLMTHDRVHCDHFHFTHECLANMLGVRRSGVTLAAGLLQHQGLIQYTRGEITIVDRKGLEAVSCLCYGASSV
ncbi:Crp/Fnr family transcriptional regulator [Pseudomonas alkylphenolica]|uniref:Crp/Fnr family transcriptional regulator n=1 Tax=Pseudomonas alkylphenolica TaxID=237609 RepID=UPI00315DC92E